MPTRFGNLMASRGAPLLAHAFGSRGEPVFWMKAFGTEYSGPANVGTEEVSEVETADGFEKQRTRTVRIERRHLPGLKVVPVKAKFKLNNVAYAVDNSGSRLDETYLTLALSRSEMTENDPLRRGS